MLKKIIIPKRTCVINGDAVRGVTFELDLDLYLVNQKIRLKGIKSFDIKKEAQKDKAKECLKYLKDLICKKNNVYLDVAGKDKYGRWLGILLLKNKEGDININDLLIKEGLVKVFNYE